ncbi:unnamed protein product [Caenorhabditis auriculariae]|uniref:Galectin n=1 Tax=Caenorhabditis auriculariae TaxID=2777116 RepID=A0A8S1H3D6_9PELO|nr:unnamed protein product [Caenorhabditis auriculariae]
MRRFFVAALFVLVPVAFCHYKHEDKDYSCRRLGHSSKGYHQDMKSRFVDFKRGLKVGDVIIIRGKLGHGDDPKRFFLDFPIGPLRYIKPKPTTFPSSFHFSAQFDLGKQIGAWFDGNDFRDIVTGDNIFTEDPFTIEIEVEEDGYKMSKDGELLGTYQTLDYTKVSCIYLENIDVKEDDGCHDEPRCDRLRGDKITVIIADGHVQHIRGKCRS